LTAVFGFGGLRPASATSQPLVKEHDRAQQAALATVQAAAQRDGTAPTGESRLRRPRSRPSWRGLDWADAHFASQGSWPSQYSGAIDGAGGQTWAGVQRTLLKGGRGLPGGTSLKKLLDRHRRKPARRPK